MGGLTDRSVGIRWDGYRCPVVRFRYRQGQVEPDNNKVELFGSTSHIHHIADYIGYSCASYGLISLLSILVQK